jgi:hypothetical protein
MSKRKVDAVNVSASKKQKTRAEARARKKMVAPSADERMRSKAWEQQCVQWWSEATVFQHTTFALRDVKNWSAYMDQHGFAVIDLDMSKRGIDVLIDAFHNDLTKLGTGIDRADPKTYRNENWVGIASKGIFKDPDSGFQHSDFTWRVRETVAPVFRTFFEHLLATRVMRLLPSLDTVGAFRNPALVGAKSHVQTAVWPHIDQGRDTPDTYQSFLNVLPSDEFSGGFMCVPGSHKFAPRFWHDFEARGKNPNQDFLMFGPEDAGLRLAVRELGGWVRVCPGPGQVVIWSSQLVHSNGAGRPGGQSRGALLRLVGYASFSAVTNAEESIDWYLEALHSGKMYNHHTTKEHMKAEHLAYPRHASYQKLNKNGAALDIKERLRRFWRIQIEGDDDRDPDEWSGEEGDYASEGEALVLDSDSASDSDDDRPLLATKTKN